MSTLHARLEIMPVAQQNIWPRLAAVSGDFVLYGGTGPVLRLGATQALFGNTFSPVDCLRALEYFEDPLLNDLSLSDRTILKNAVQEVVLRGAPAGSTGKSTTLFD